MFEISFVSETFRETLDQLALWLGNKPENNVILFDQSIGKGKVFVGELEPGLFIRAWDYSLAEDTQFQLKPIADESKLYFTASYLLTPAAFQIKTGNRNKETYLKVTNLNNGIVYACNHEFVYKVMAGKSVKLLEICVTKNWLLDEFPGGGDKVRELFSLNTHKKSWLTQPLSLPDYSIAGQLVEKVFANIPDKIFLRSRALILLDDLVQAIGEKIVPAPSYAIDMIEVEKYLLSFLKGRLPDLKEIAKKFSLSESTLKRHFQKKYGQNIYEYYLGKKMELARELLHEKNMTVSEVAHIMGYEKHSSFSSIFKKHFGDAPSSVINEE